MTLETVLLEAPAAAHAAPSLALFLAAAVSAFVVLVGTLWLGRRLDIVTKAG